ncbi:BTAD domain-containing putative transcriptional regulator [Streptomyces violascens]|uniref:BTAD domain-containing putative transcriptional regulator n=1 Tax=Streptomyces violascens TaxID=67381 RepID=UPI00167B99D0|nr:BTAD domain-containing putative transcriptional regulator [Streptomyces violascens]GGT85341.1 ATPase AAA [Streptomyces violascens]
MLTFGVLGPLEAAANGTPVEVQGPQRRLMLARLLVAQGQVVSVESLIDGLWDGVPPLRATGVLRTVVFGLRKALEPDRPPRTPPRLLISAPTGYALRVPEEAVDAWRFEAAVRGTRAGGTPPEVVLRQLDRALALWRGPAYAEFAAARWAAREAARLEEFRARAVEQRSQALITLGRAAEPLPDLEAQVLEHPLREESWRLLALALYQAGRQGDALAALRRVRRVLMNDLGVEPGAELRRLEADVLSQAPRLEPAVSARPSLRPASSVTPPGVRPASAAPAAPPFVGRAGEMARLEETAAVAAAGRLTLALVTGEPGVGKTRLVEQFGAVLARRGWTCVRGRCPESGGAPAAWPWTELLSELADAGHEPHPATARVLAPLLKSASAHTSHDATGGRFRMRNAVVDHLTATARTAPLLIVVEDLHRADEETLDLLAHLVDGAGAAPVVVVATLRSHEESPGLRDALGQLARHSPVRIDLAGLSGEAVAELLLSGAPELDEATVRAIAERTGGNAFFVCETARLISAAGAEDALSQVPAGVHAVVRQRLARLPETAQALLRQATVLGREVDLDVLAAMTDSDPETVATAVETALDAGLLVEDGPDQVRFVHILVRDALYEEVPKVRRARWHARAGTELQRLRPAEVSLLAYHFLAAGDRASAPRAARFARAAAEQAAWRFAHREAARLWQEAVAAHDRSGVHDERTRLELVMGTIRALALAGDVVTARERRNAAIADAEKLGDPEFTADLLSAFDVPTIWTNRRYAAKDDQVVAAAEGVLRLLPPYAEEARCRVLTTLALELDGTQDDRGRQAAQQAEALARGLDRPDLLAQALNARHAHAYHRAGLAPERLGIGRELLALGVHHELAAVEVLGHVILAQAHAALADPETADEHADAVERLADRYDLPLPGTLLGWYRAMRLSIAGRFTDADTAYRRTTERLGESWMWGIERDLLHFALFCLYIQNGTLLDLAGEADEQYQRWGSNYARGKALMLLAEGDAAEARAVTSAARELPRDYLLEARLGLAAILAVSLDDRDMAASVYEELLPAADCLAGAGSGVVTLGPVAHYLGELARCLGRPEQAAAHHRHALAIAERTGAPHWAEAARTALSRGGHG